MEDLNEYSELHQFNETCLSSPQQLSALKKVSDSAHVKKVTSGFDRPLSETDFKDNAVQLEKSVVYLQSELQKLVDSGAVQNKTKLDITVQSFLVSSLIVCGEHSTEELWTSCCTVKSAGSILNHLCVLFSLDTQNVLGGLESKWKFSVCKLLFDALKPKLRKATWKQYPASFTCYRWILLNAQAQQISENFEEFLHPALIAVDDYEMCNQVKGIHCLSRIISNVTRTDLCHLGYDDVIYGALEHLLYVKEPDIIMCLVPCLSQFLQKVERGYTNKEDALQFTRYDRALKIFLGNMEMEQYIMRRKVYVNVLPLFLDSMGLPMLRWSKRLLRIFEDYLLVDDGSAGFSTGKALEAVKVYLLHAWPVVPKNMDALLEYLLKLLLEMTDLDPSRKISSETLETILCLIEDCLHLIVKTSNVRVKELCSGINSASFNSKFDEIINRILLPG
ncbi:TELO2-interacting protein 2-like [Hetaerina americana]|uniref:TELO2-interacting protein 2-like n=1 Tax=Hetaerina americana TaxID=62018 RepID=UPI003A7F1F23